MFHVITQATVDPDRQLHLTFMDGKRVSVDLNQYVARGGVFNTLADPAVRNQVRIGDGGRYIEWPGEIDLCADALWLEGQAISNSFTASAQA